MSLTVGAHLCAFLPSGPLATEAALGMHNHAICFLFLSPPPLLINLSTGWGGG